MEKIDAETLIKIGLVEDKKNENYLQRVFFYATDLDSTPQTVIEFTLYNKPIAGVSTLLRCQTKPKGASGENSVHICNVLYLHQLQQALRLCGIDYPVEL